MRTLSSTSLATSISLSQSHVLPLCIPALSPSPTPSSPSLRFCVSSSLAPTSASTRRLAAEAAAAAATMFVTLSFSFFVISDCNLATVAIPSASASLTLMRAEDTPLEAAVEPKLVLRVEPFPAIRGVRSCSDSVSSSPEPE